MTNVKEIDVIALGDDVIYGPGPGESNVTPEMREKWNKMFVTIEGILEDFGISSDNAVVERQDAFMSVLLEREFSFEKATELLYALEKYFRLAEFRYVAEEDGYTEFVPHVQFCIYEKE